MATAALVNQDIEIGRHIVAALTRANVPVTVYLWALVSEEWLFIVATPLVDSKGPLPAYDQVNRALQRAGVLADVPRQMIFLMSPNDPELRALEKQSKAMPQESFRVVNASIAGRFVEDAYLYTGSIHIVQLENSRGTVPHKYSVIYAPYSGPGGAVPSVKLDGVENVRAFLTSKLHVDHFAADLALKELSAKRSTSIPNVQLKTRELKRLGLL
jgi:hypothetical protein